VLFSDFDFAAHQLWKQTITGAASSFAAASRKRYVKKPAVARRSAASAAIGNLDLLPDIRSLLPVRRKGAPYFEYI